MCPVYPDAMCRLYISFLRHTCICHRVCPKFQWHVIFVFPWHPINAHPDFLVGKRFSMPHVLTSIMYVMFSMATRAHLILTYSRLKHGSCFYDHYVILLATDSHHENTVHVFMTFMSFFWTHILSPTTHHMCFCHRTLTYSTSHIYKGSSFSRQFRMTRFFVAFELPSPPLVCSLPHNPSTPPHHITLLPTTSPPPHPTTFVQGTIQPPPP